MREQILQAFNVAMHTDVEQIELSTDVNGDLIVLTNGKGMPEFRTVTAESIL